MTRRYLAGALVAGACVVSACRFAQDVVAVRYEECVQTLVIGTRGIDLVHRPGCLAF